MEKLLFDSLILALNFLKYSIPGLIIGIFIAELLIEKGIIEKTTLIGKPFIKFSNLPNECALSFVTAFINANAMLVDFYKEGRIGRKELYIASLMNAFPAMVRHWYFMVPVLIAILDGLGLIYFSILVLIGFIQTTIFALAGKILIKKSAVQYSHNSTATIEKQRNHPKHLKESLKNILKRTKKHSIPILKTMIIATYITSLLIVLGFFDYLTSAIRGWVTTLPLSTEEISIAVTLMVNRVAAYTLGANLLSAKLITSLALLRALLLGSLLSNITVLRWLIPYYIGIYGVRNGSRIMIFSMTVRSVIIIMLICILWVIV